MKDHDLDNVVKVIQNATAFLICTGAGMSADSGIPVYRDPNNGKQWEGFKEGELKSKYGLTKEEIKQFGKDDLMVQKAKSFWKYFLDKANLLWESEPHQGYQILNDIISKHPYYIVTSNIDGYHKRSGSPGNRIVECHGLFLDDEGNIPVQCSIGEHNCNPNTWKIPFKSIDIDNLPMCPLCDNPVRPNYLSINDTYCIITPFTFSPVRQELTKWIKEAKDSSVHEDFRNLVILEIGAGDQVMAIRNRAQMTWEKVPGSFWIRINPDLDQSNLGDSSNSRFVHLKMGALEALTRISQKLH